MVSSVKHTCLMKYQPGVLWTDSTMETIVSWVERGTENDERWAPVEDFAGDK